MKPKELEWARRYGGGKREGTGGKGNRWGGVGMGWRGSKES